MRNYLFASAIALGLALVSSATAAPVGTAFTYQGELRVAGSATSAPHDFEFALFNVAGGGVAIASVARPDEAVNGGLFSVELDFTDVPFAASEAYWLEVRVRDGASTGPFTTLTPRQHVAPVPYAVNARTVQAGAIGSPQLADLSVAQRHLRVASVSQFNLQDESVGSDQIQIGAVGSQQIANGSISGADLGAGVVNSGHVQDGSLQSHDLVAGSIGAVQLAVGAVGSSQLAPDSVQTQHLAANAVNNEKLLDNAVTSVKLQDGSVGSDDIASASVLSVHLRDFAVSSAKLTDGAVTTNKLAANSVLSQAIADGEVRSADLAPGAVGAAQLNDSAVTTAKLVNGAVTNEKLQFNAVNTFQLADEAVTQQKIAPGAVSGSNIAIGAIGSGHVADGSIAASDLAFAPGDVTAVSAGVGLSGGGPGGDLTLSVNLAQIQARVSASCAIGHYFRGIAADGSVACEPVPGVPSLSTLYDPAFEVGADLSMAIGADGYPVIAHRAGPPAALSRLEVIKCRNSACTDAVSFAVVDDPANAVGFDTSIAIGTDGFPVISYFDATAQALKVAKCADAACVSPAVITTVDDDPVNNVGRFNSIAVGSDNLPAISYWDATAGTLKLVKCVTADCGTALAPVIVDDIANETGVYTALALDAANLPLIAHRDETANALRVSKCSTVTCSGAVTSTTIDDPINDVGADPSVAIGSDGIPMIAYRDNSASALKVLRCANSACTSAASITTVDDPVNLVGNHSSIAIGADHLAVIAYQDSSAGALKVAKCANTACSAASSLVTVDDPATVVGDFAALRLGHDGLPVIVYQDATADAIKVVKCGTRSCQ